MHLQKRLRLYATFLISAALVQGTVSVSHALSNRVVDGDTLEINGTTIRLHGIDAPRRLCEENGVHLIEIRFDEPLTAAVLRTRLRCYVH